MSAIDLIEVSDGDFDWMLGISSGRGNLRLPPGGVADPAVLRIVRQMTKTLHEAGCMSSWMIVREGEVVGLCSYKRPPAEGRAEIGYGTASHRSGAGIATGAVARIVCVATADPAIEALTAQTAIDNVASQRVLERNGFVQTGRHTDGEDGEVIEWVRRLR